MWCWSWNNRSLACQRVDVLQQSAMLFYPWQVEDLTICASAPRVCDYTKTQRPNDFRQCLLDIIELFASGWHQGLGNRRVKLPEKVNRLLEPQKKHPICDLWLPWCLFQILGLNLENDWKQLSAKHVERPLMQTQRSFKITNVSAVHKKWAINADMFRGDILQHIAPFSRQQCEGDARTYSYILEPDIQAIVQNTLKDDMVTKQKVHMSVCVCVFCKPAAPMAALAKNC